MDNLDSKLLSALQNAFPLVSKPFTVLGEMIGVTGDEVIRRIRQFKENGIIRQISPVFDARSLGYITTLVAMRVSEDGMEHCTEVLQATPFISHAYERDHSFNVWFTLAMPGFDEIEKEMERIGNIVSAEKIFQLPSVKLYKIGAFFDTDEVPQAAIMETRTAGELSADDRLVINALQQDLSLTARPFLGIADETDLDEGKFLEVCHSLMERGLMRRYGAAVNHRRVGYTANGMVCWQVPPEKTKEAGHYLASLREVSHCYERVTNAEWTHNIFAMIHGKERETCYRIAEEASKHLGLEDYMVLFSTRELKKTRIRYLV